MVKRFRKSIPFLFLLLLNQYLFAQTGQSLPFLPDVVVFKLKDGSSSQESSGTNGARTLSALPPGGEKAAELAHKFGAKRAYQAIQQENHTKKNSILSRTQTPPQALAQVYKLELAPGQNVQEAIAFLQSSKEVEYAEPYYLPHLLAKPDDEHLSLQTYLNTIKAFNAWDISQGSGDVVIGILDTGVDFDHPDLKENLYLNTADPEDGIDNDGDGYVDNYRGWDFANNDNNPSADNNQHGTFVTGFSSASTNNDIGIAGTGYKCRYMPIKIFRSENNIFSNGYEAMVYAANMGCKVINLSWGAAGNRSQYVQDIINYVVLEKDVVIVAAAGNESAEKNYYPASYDNVLSVTSSDLNDAKSGYATWSRYVDLMAPGNNVYSTQNGGGYGTGYGTSYASPIVAGAAALVRSYFPDLNAQQVMERLRLSTDDVSKVGSNPTYKEKIGKGRLNMQKALGNSVSPAIRMQQFDFFNGSGPYAFYNDTLEIRMDFKNFLNPSTNLTVKLSTDSKYVTILNGSVQLNAVNTLETVRNDTIPFRIYLHPNLPNDHLIFFRLEYSDINYEDYQHFELRTSGDFLDFKVDDLSLTIASNGNLGYNNDYNLFGTGFRYQNKSLAHNLGLVLAANNKTVANNIIQTINPVVRNKDFKINTRLRVFNNSTASRDARSVFETRNTPESPLNLMIEQKILGWEDEDPSSGIVVEYRIINRGTTEYPELYAGMFADFDIQEFFRNKAAWDEENQLGYAYDHQESRYAGVALLNSEYEVGFHAMDLASGNGNQSEYTDSLSRAQKFSYLSNGISKTTAGSQGSGNDVAQFLSAKITGLAPHESKKLAFTLVTASTLEELGTAVQLARERYQKYLLNPPVNSQVLVCPGANLNLELPAGQEHEIYSDPLGKNLLGRGTSIQFQNLTESTSIYLANASQAWLGDIEQIQVIVRDPVAFFEMSADTLSINPGETAMLQLTDQSAYPASWNWNFNNGYKSKKQSPKAYFNNAGTYTISLDYTNDANCSAGISKTLVVVEKNQPPLFSNLLFCNGETATIQAEDGSPFTLYTDPLKKEKLFSGTTYTPNLVSGSTTYYATSGSGAFESDAVELKVESFTGGIDFTYAVDSQATELFALNFKAQLHNENQAGRIDWFVRGKLISSGDSLHLPYNQDEHSISVQAIAYYKNGCQASFSKEVILGAAPKPTIPAPSFCKGSAVHLRPVDEGLYYFYADANKTVLLLKGREYVLNSVLDETSIYATNVSLGKESDTVHVRIKLPNNLASFSPLTDTIFMGSTVQFKSLHPDAVQHEWNFGNGITSTLASPEQLYTSMGSFTITHTSESSNGCKETLSRTFVVVEPTAIEKENAYSTGRNEIIKIYPNPAQEYISIELPLPLQSGATLLLQDIRGRTIQQEVIKVGQQTLQLNTRALNAGWYLIQIRNEKVFYSGRVLKE